MSFSPHAAVLAALAMVHHSTVVADDVPRESPNPSAAQICEPHIDVSEGAELDKLPSCVQARLLEDIICHLPELEDEKECLCRSNFYTLKRDCDHCVLAHGGMSQRTFDFYGTILDAAWNEFCNDSPAGNELPFAEVWDGARHLASMPTVGDTSIVDYFALATPDPASHTIWSAVTTYKAKVKPTANGTTPDLSHTVFTAVRTVEADVDADDDEELPDCTESPLMGAETDSSWNTKTTWTTETSWSTSWSTESSGSTTTTLVLPEEHEHLARSLGSSLLSPTFPHVARQLKKLPGGSKPPTGGRCRLKSGNSGNRPVASSGSPGPTVSVGTGSIDDDSIFPFNLTTDSAANSDEPFGNATSLWKGGDAVDGATGLIQGISLPAHAIWFLAMVWAVM